MSKPGGSQPRTAVRLAFLLKPDAGLPVIRGATLAWVSVRVVESADALPHLLSGSADRTVAIWDVWTGARVQSLHGHTAGVTQVLLAERYGRQLVVSGSRDQVIPSTGTSVPLPPQPSLTCELFTPACICLLWPGKHRRSFERRISSRLRQAPAGLGNAVCVLLNRNS